MTPLKPYYENDRSMIYNEDVLDFLALFDSNVDLIATSPPYNVGKPYGGDAEADQMAYPDYLDWLDEVWRLSYNALVDGGRLAINVADLDRNPYRSSHSDIYARMKRMSSEHLISANWYPMGIIVWHKTIPLGGTAWGSWESASAPSLRGEHEYILIFGKNGKKKAPAIVGSKSGPYDKIDGASEFMSLTREVWQFLPETNKNHPAPFPLQLPTNLIKLLTFENDLVVDPFMGTGTTLEAAKMLGRFGIGNDNVLKYCEMSLRTIAASTMFDGEA